MKYILPFLLFFSIATHAKINADDYVYQVIYPGAVELSRSEYALELLKLALSYSEYSFALRGSGGHFPTPRNFTFLKKQQEINLLWTSTSIEREKEFLAVRIPILKGLLGLRLPLVLNKNKYQLNVDSLAQLQQYSAGQMLSWVDSKVLKHNKLQVTGSPNYSALFKMLSAERFDYFPRSITEIWQEIEHHPELPLAVAESFAIHYPSAMYFFVNKANHFLHDEIKSGLNKAIADGEFDKLFYQYHQQYLQKSKMSQRHIIELKNPYMPKETPLDRKELWLSIGQ